MERHLYLLRNHGRLKALKKQLRTGLCHVPGLHQSENEDVSLLFKSRNKNLTCYLHFKKLAFSLFWELTYGFIFLNFCGCAS